MHFWEFYGGCNVFTSECNNIGLTVGPSVDILPAATRNRLQLDVLRPSSQTLLWQLWLEAQPEWTHCAWPCTFWIPLGRMTALRIHDEWDALSQRNRAHVRFCTHALRTQAAARHKGSGEQLAGAISLNKNPSGDFEGAWFRRICVSFLCMGPLQSRQWASLEENVALVSNGYLSFLERQCTCGHDAHDIIRGVVESGPRAGKKESSRIR